MKLQLIPDAKLSWRFWSVRATVLLGIMSSIQGELFPMVKPLFTAAQWNYILPTWLLVIIVLRQIAQPGLAAKRADLEVDAAEAYPAGGSDARDVMIDAKAQHLYRSTNPNKPWSQVSDASKAKWRQVAAAAHEYAVDTMEAR